MCWFQHVQWLLCAGALRFALPVPALAANGRDLCFGPLEALMQLSFWRDGFEAEKKSQV